MDTDKKIKAYALQNAVKFKGKANQGAIVGKLISEDPTLKAKLKELAPKIGKILKEVNGMSADEQAKELAKYSNLLKEKPKEKKEDRNIFKFLGIGDDEKIITVFPPEPSKYPHIGHAKAALMNYLLAKKYNGKFYLRFEDTNPTLAKKEFYDILKENLEWLGIRPEKVFYASDYMQDYYGLAHKVIEKGKAYVCKCPQEDMREQRMKGIPCKCRENAVDQNIHLWKQLFTMEEGKAVLRLKIDLKHKNSTMRDPTIFRIIDEEHVRLGKEYRVWPNYDFENSVMDGLTGITHRLRSKEFELRAELQRYIQKMLGFKPTKTYEFARFNMVGVLSSGRVIREKVQSGELLGWDDPALTTIMALRRRGFTSESIRKFVESTGITKAEATLTWDDLIIHNKRLLDKDAKRYFFVEDPVEIDVEDAPHLEVELDLHPENLKGGRMLRTAGKIYITKKDFEALEKAKFARLIDLMNIKFEDGKVKFVSLNFADFKSQGGKLIIHWLPVEDELNKVEILMPDKSVKIGVAEDAIADLVPGSIIQFERCGFCRLDSSEGKEYKFWYTHG